MGTTLRSRSPADSDTAAARDVRLLLSAALLAVAYPPFNLLIPSFVALVPFALWLESLPGGPGSDRAVLRGGFFLGMLYYGILLYWILFALLRYTVLAVLAYLATVAVVAAMFAVATLGTHKAVGRLGWPVWLALPVFWTAAEWLRGHLGPLSFPWMEFGDTLVGFPSLVGAADAVGARGISFWLVLLNGLVAAGILAGRSGQWRRLRRLGAAWCILLAVPVAYSLYRWHALVLRPAATVVVLQPNVPEDLKLQPEAAVQRALRSADTLIARGRANWPPRPDLVVLPETVFPVLVDPVPSLGYGGRPELAGWARELARNLSTPVLYGAIGSEDRGGGQYRYFNSGLLVDTAGRRVARYDKRDLVPVVERVPFANPAWFSGLQYFGGFSPGQSSLIFSSGAARLGVLICYESIFADLSRTYRREGADFLVNITNDAWFGRGGPWWDETTALWQHPAHLVMRAIENRIGVARSANTGVSEFVDPLGRVSQETRLFEPAAISGTVLTTDEVTPFTRMGDVIGWLCALGSVGAGFVLVMRGR